MFIQRLVSGLLCVFASLTPLLAPLCTPLRQGSAALHPSLLSSSGRRALLDSLFARLGPAPRPGLEKESFFLVVIDDYSRYTVVFPLAKKTDMNSTLIRWFLVTEATRGSRVRCLHSDRGGLAMEIVRSSMIHARTTHFCGPKRSLRCPPAKSQALCLTARGLTDQSLDRVPWYHLLPESHFHSHRSNHRHYHARLQWTLGVLVLEARALGVGAEDTRAEGTGTGGAKTGGAGAEGAGTGGARPGGAGVRGTGTGCASSGGAAAAAAPTVTSTLAVSTCELGPWSPFLLSVPLTASCSRSSSSSLSPAVFSPPRSEHTLVVPHSRVTPCPPRACPSSLVDDLRTVMLRSSPRRSPPSSFLSSPPESSRTASTHPITYYYCTAHHVVSRVLASLVTGPRASPFSISTLVAPVGDFPGTRRLDYATQMVATRPLAAEGEYSLGCNMLEDRQFELE
ncbi:unnamed protein product [Closterium sp. NIES-54]